MKKVVLKVDMHDDKCKKKAMKTVSSLSGVHSIDLKDGKLTVTGYVDPVEVMDKLRKICHTEIESVRPATEEKAPAKEDPKKDDPKDEYVNWLAKTYGYNPKKDPKDEYVTWLLKSYGYQLPPIHYPPPPAHGCSYRPVEEDPNSCVIC